MVYGSNSQPLTSGRMLLAWCLRAALVLLTLLAFWPVTRLSFTGLDDGFFVTENTRVKAGLSMDNVAWAFGDMSSGYYVPVTWLSYMLDSMIWGNGPGGFHAVNLAIHVANALLIFEILRASTGSLWRSAAVAMLFAIHPLRVEAVAWIAERNHLLSAFFGLVALRLYIAYCRKLSAGWLVLSWIAFGISVLAKPSMVLFGLALFLVDLWPLKRFHTTRARRLIAEKLPFIITGMAIALVSIATAQQRTANAALGNPTIGVRVENAVVCSCDYIASLAELALPSGSPLCIIYPFPREVPLWEVIVAGILWTCLILLALWRLRRDPLLMFGIGWFLVLMLPMMGLVTFSIPIARADRYTYIPQVGLLAALLFLDATLVCIHKLGKTASVGVILAVALVLLFSTRMQIGLWKDDVTLFGNAVSHTRGNPVAEEVLGCALGDRGRRDQAIEHLQRAIAMAPSWTLPRFALASFYIEARQPELAIEQYEAILKFNPDDSKTHTNLAVLLADRGRSQEAMTHYQAAIAIDGQNVTAYYNMGRLYLATAHPQSAAACFRQCVGIDPHYSPALEALRGLARH